MIERIKKAFGCRIDDYRLRIEMADDIIKSFDIILNQAHLSENNSASVTWARQEVLEYQRMFLYEQ